MAVVGLLNPSQPSISFGAGPDFTAESFSVGGIAVFHAPALASDVLFNQKSLRKAEKPPEQVSSTNVALMGQGCGDHRIDDLPAPLSDWYPQVHRLT